MILIMSKSTDIQVVEATLYYLPMQMRVPLKFGSETIHQITCARVRVTVQDTAGNQATGWGETPLSVTWVWPSTLGYDPRHVAMQAVCQTLTEKITQFKHSGHPLEIGHAFIEDELPKLLDIANADKAADEHMPYLAALVSFSAFDIAIHDAFGNLLGVPTYDTYNSQYMNQDLSAFLAPAPDTEVRFEGQYPADFLAEEVPTKLTTWHLVGGVDPLTVDDATGNEPNDEHPVFLDEWIQSNGLKALKIKLRGNDLPWDYQRMVAIGKLAIQYDVSWLSPDFNCTVTDPAYVNQILDRLRDKHPRIYGMVLYVEQPFPHDLQANRIDVHSVSARKPLFMDESAHDWKFVQLGRSLGWTGVALKTCKTQTGALLSLCWAKAHGMPLMVQDLTNPTLAMIPHVQLAAHAKTIMGVEVNSMQFYPDASAPEAKIHHGLYQRRHGILDLSTLGPTGMGYRVDEIKRELPEPACSFQ